jgi:iron-sulfur cluster repair protein YtfE (RIC family)
MASTLPTVAHEHHERLLAHVDRMPAIGDAIGTQAADGWRTELADLASFLTGTLIPHMEAAERTLYPELERILQNQHSMTPMRREHEQMQRLVAELAALREHLGVRVPSTREVVALRRSVFSLYALLKIHLAEEELYLRIVEHGVTSEAAGVLAAAMEHPMVTAS